MDHRFKVSHLGITVLLLVVTLLPLGVSSAQEAPDIPVLTSPMDGSIQNTDTPLFQWSDVTADVYKLVIKDESGVKFLKQKLNSADVCEEFTACSYSLVNVDLTFTENGDYLWKIVAKNEFGKAKSETAGFTIDFPGAPELVSPADGDTLISPVSDLMSFSWNEVVTATRYVFSIKHLESGEKVKQTLDNPVCPSGVCEYTLPVLLFPGTFTWRFTAQQPPISNKSKSEKRTLIVQ
jgi:hypothetical protein